MRLWKFNYFSLSFEVVRACLNFSLILLEGEDSFTAWTGFEVEQPTQIVIEGYEIILPLIEIFDTKVIAALENDLVGLEKVELWSVAFDDWSETQFHDNLRFSYYFVCYNLVCITGNE